MITTKVQDVAVLGIALVLGLLLVKEMVSVNSSSQRQNSSKPQRAAPGNTAVGVDQNPVRVRRRYSGNMKDSQRTISISVDIVSAAGPNISAKVSINDYGPELWSGNYDAQNQILVLESKQRDTLYVQYSGGGNWSGETRIVDEASRDGPDKISHLPTVLALEE